MARRIALVVLCEDQKGLGQSFAAAFLNRFQFPTRLGTRYVKGPDKAGVLRKFPEEVRSLLQQGAETHLFVLMDADGLSYESNLKALMDTLSPTLLHEVSETGRVHLICPNYELENWCRHLEGRAVTEARDLKLEYKRDSDCRDAARTLADACKSRKELASPLPSLASACDRWHIYVEQHRL